MNVIANVKQKYASYQSLDAKDKKTFWKEALINNALYILLVIAIIYTYTQTVSYTHLTLPTIDDV